MSPHPPPLGRRPVPLIALAVVLITAGATSSAAITSPAAPRSSAARSSAARSSAARSSAARTSAARTSAARTSAGAADSARLVAVRAALDSFITDFNNLDSGRFAARWTLDASALLPFADTPDRLDGRDAVVGRFLAYFRQMRLERTGPPYLRMVLADVHVELLGSDHALVSYAFPGGGTRQRRTLVMQAGGDGRWRIRHFHGSAHP